MIIWKVETGKLVRRCVLILSLLSFRPSLMALSLYPPFLPASNPPFLPASNPTFSFSLLENELMFCFGLLVSCRRPSARSAVSRDSKRNRERIMERIIRERQVSTRLVGRRTTGGVFFACVLARVSACARVYVCLCVRACVCLCVYLTE